MKMDTKINIAIADDHNLFRKGLKSLLRDFDFVGEIYEASNGSELLDVLSIVNPFPEIVLLDINMPVMDGIKATEKIREKYNDLKIIVLTMEDNEHFVLQMLDYGINGYLLKNCDPDELADAIESVMKKDFYFTENITDFIHKAYFLKNHIHQKKQEVPNLTSREKEILQLICQEMNTYEIADRLFLSPRTVESHRKNIIEKAGVKNIAGLIIYAIRNNWVEI
jgi:DNA-binding NarL/FixJ family response regulator